MAIANQSAVADARTTYEALVDNALTNARATGVWQALARRINPTGSVAHQLTLPGATPTWQEWVDERDSSGFRKMSKTIPLKVYEKSIELYRTDVVYDKDGSTAAALDAFVGRDVEAIWDKLVMAALAANPTGVDGVSLINDSHPFAENAGTWDNKNTNALSFDEFDGEVERMMGLKDEFGEPLNLEPKVLVVSTSDRRLAREIVGAEDRPISVGTAGAINAAGVGATGITNVYKADNWTLIVEPRFTSGDWVIVDPRYVPIALCVWRDPEVVIIDDMNADRRVRRDKFFYGVEADATADGAQPWGIAGKLS